MGCKTTHEKCWSSRCTAPSDYSATLPFPHFHIEGIILLATFSKCLKRWNWVYVKWKTLQPAPAPDLVNPIKDHKFFSRKAFLKRVTLPLVKQLTEYKHYGQHVKPFPNTTGFWCFKAIPNPYEEKEKGESTSNISLKIHYKVISFSLVKSKTKPGKQFLSCDTDGWPTNSVWTTLCFDILTVTQYLSASAEKSLKPGLGGFEHS